MYYETMSVDNLLKCSFCACKFSTVVKLIPDCMSSICGDCYDSLMESSDNTKQFSCRSCGQSHFVPKRGLRDHTLALDMLKIQRNEKPLSTGAKELKSLIEEVHDKIGMLKAREDTQEINVYCDSLEMDVNMAADSAIKHVKSLQEGLLKEINAYRAGALAARSANRSASSGNGSAPNDKNTELNELSRKADSFSKEWHAFFNQMKQLANDSKIDTAKTEARNLISDAEKLKHKFDCKMLKGRFLKFKEKESFNASKDLFGTVYLDFSFYHAPDFAEHLLHSLNAQNNVHQIVFLPDGDLAICSGDHSVQIWNLKSGKPIYELKSHKRNVSLLQLLDNRHLATGFSDNTIQIWDLSKREVVRTISTGSYSSYASNSLRTIKAMKNGYFASWSYSEQVKMWHTHTGFQGIPTEGSGFTKCFLDVLSDGRLVTCSEISYVSTIQIWNPETGKLIKSIPSKTRHACSIAVLKDDRIAIGYKEGLIKVFNPADVSKVQTIEKCHQGQICSLLALFDRYLVSGGPSVDPTIKIWDVVDNKLVRTISNQHTSSISSLSVSNDGKYLASGSQDKLVKIWSLEH